MKKLFDRCLDAEYIHTKEDGDYAIEIDGKTIYLLFQWTNSRMDWVSNFDFPAKAYNHTNVKWHVHRGFLRVWKAMRDDIEAEVDKIINEHKVEKIICIGYSHGAAISLLATEDMEYHYGHMLHVEGWGFGCPRVLWGWIPAEIKDRLRNFTPVRNIPDLVTHVPPAAFGYRHLNLLEIGKKGKYTPIDAHRASAYLDEMEY